MSATFVSIREDHVIDADAAAQLLGVSPYTIREWARKREIPALHLGRLWRFRESALLEWVAQKERAPR